MLVPCVDLLLPDTQAQTHTHTYKLQSKPQLTSYPHSSNPPSSTPTKKVSTDGSCGSTSGFTCQGSTFGTCCSQYGWCGSSTDHCAVGCQTAFGTCTSGGAPTTSAAPTPSAAPSKVSTDGTCGGAKGLTCKGSAFGNCCSQYGWCGSTSGHCGTGCNKGFGSCS